MPEYYLKVTTWGWWAPTPKGVRGGTCSSMKGDTAELEILEHFKFLAPRIVEELCKKVANPNFKAEVSSVSLIEGQDALIVIKTSCEVPIDAWIKCTQKISMVDRGISKADITEELPDTSKPGVMPWSGWTPIMRK